VKVNTKQKILNKAIELFNEKGFASVTLFEIAGELEMTRGNLTYHFRDKEALLIAIVDQLWSLQEDRRSQTRSLPSFENLHNQAQLFYAIQKKYAFIFLDNHVINHPAIRENFKKQVKNHIKDIEATIAFSIAAGNMHPEPYEGIYHNLAFNTWMVSFFWINQQVVKGEEIQNYIEEGEMKIWSMLLPHLTDKGLKAFRNFFGDDYLKKLGKSFKADISEYVGF